MHDVELLNVGGATPVSGVAIEDDLGVDGPILVGFGAGILTVSSSMSHLEPKSLKLHELNESGLVSIPLAKAEGDAMTRGRM